MQTCKLCQSSTEGKEYSDLDDDILKRLEFLQIDLAYNDEESNFLCSQCDEKIENIFDFKLCVVINTTNMKNMPRQSTVEVATESIKCHLCKNYGDQQIMISLTKLKDDDRMMEVFQHHLQEMDLENVEDSMVCEVCQKSLVIFWSLIESWSKSRNLNDDDMTDDDDDNFECVALKKENLENDDFSDTNGKRATENGNCKKRQLSSGGNSSDSDNSIKMEHNEILDGNGGACLSTDDVKKEEIKEIDNQQLKVEEVEIKDEDELLEDHVNHRIELEDKNHAKMFGCYHCSYQTNVKSGLKQHVKAHKRIHDLEEYKFKKGSFETTYKTSSKIPLLKYRILNAIQMYKCQECSYETKYKRNLEMHLLTHKKIQMYKCKVCSYETKYNGRLRKHMLKHTSLNNIRIELEDKNHAKIFGCYYCSYQTNVKSDLKQHVKVHKRIHYLEEYKFKKGSFEPTYKTSSKIPLLKYRISNAIQMYKCQECSFETKYKRNLEMHLLTHKKIQMYKCKECSYETKYKGHLRKHMLKHGSLNKIQMYKCKECYYETPYKEYLKPHLLKHKSLMKSKCLSPMNVLMKRNVNEI